MRRDAARDSHSPCNQGTIAEHTFDSWVEVLWDDGTRTSCRRQSLTIVEDAPAIPVQRKPRRKEARVPRPTESHNEMVSRVIGERLEELGLSGAEAARRAGVSGPVVSHLKRQTSSATRNRKTLEHISKAALQWPPNYLPALVHGEINPDGSPRRAVPAPPRERVVEAAPPARGRLKGRIEQQERELADLRARVETLEGVLAELGGAVGSGRTHRRAG